MCIATCLGSVSCCTTVCALSAVVMLPGAAHQPLAWGFCFIMLPCWLALLPGGAFFATAMSPAGSTRSGLLCL